MNAEREKISQEEVRKQKLAEIRGLGINPYPYEYATTATAATVVTSHGANPKATEAKAVRLAGRLTSRRIMGASSFADLQDDSGTIQLHLHRDTLCPGENKILYNDLYKRLLDIGDFIGVEGYPFITKTGALSIKVHKLTLLSKALLPLPAVKEVKRGGATQVFYSFSDPEQRYRQRYVDLVLNKKARKIFEQRATIIQTMREHFNKEGYLEVETPILQPIYGGAHARPFTTHHHALDMELYLRISNELYLKRLIVGGYKGVYEFAKNFRNEGLSRFHNPEFTIVELYIAYRDYLWMMTYIEELLKAIAIKLHGTTQVPAGDGVIDFGGSWKRFTFFGAIRHFTGVDLRKMGVDELQKTAAKLGVECAPDVTRSKVLDAIFSHCCEPKFIEPTFITDYPIEMSPLAKQHREDPGLVERFELFVNGKELANAYSELNDPMEQQRRLERQQQFQRKGDVEAMVVDKDYVRALSYGMPPTAGIGIGVDRLTMVMTGAPSIQEVIFFPQMRKEKDVGKVKV